MEKKYFDDRVYEKTDFTETGLPVGDYDNCRFINCNFSGVDLSGISFSECKFNDCNLSTAKLIKTALKDIYFIDCKLLGLHFENCSDFLFEVSFENCVLNLSSFYQRKLKNTPFNGCSLQETDFTEADVSGAVFSNCDLLKARFENSNLEKTDFCTARNFSIDPELNKIKKAKFSASGIAGLLDKYDIEIV